MTVLIGFFKNHQNISRTVIDLQIIIKKMLKAVIYVRQKYLDIALRLERIWVCGCYFVSSPHTPPPPTPGILSGAYFSLFIHRNSYIFRQALVFYQIVCHENGLIADKYTSVPFEIHSMLVDSCFSL